MSISTSARPKVLVVDDSEANLFTFESILETVDVDVVRAASGKEAIHATRTNDLALVLLDVQMPEMDGFETAALIRAHDATKDLPIIFVTALDEDEQYRARGYEVGAVDYLTKPVKPTMLRAKVLAFLNLHKSKRQLLRDKEELEERISRSSVATEVIAPRPGDPAARIDPSDAGSPRQVRKVQFIDLLQEALRDRYAIERKLGEGGMATVYLAQDRHQPRWVAVKVFRGAGLRGSDGWQLIASGGGTAAQRFLREIQIAANLLHPHILPLFDSGEAAGFPFYAMPHIAGGSVRDWLERHGQLPFNDAIGTVLEVADALAYAHRQSVVHRDIKPENVLLHEGHALVADFGIATALDIHSEKLTAPGTVPGTPSYMSPEQAMGKSVDGRSDIYSLGSMLYEMLAGRAPFEGPNQQAVFAQVLIEDPPPIETFRPDIPQPLAAIIMRAISRAPDDRFSAAGDLAAALRSSLSP